jgi:hypothetical protein
MAYATLAHRRLVVAGLSLACVALLAACGSSSKSAGGTTTSSSSAAAGATTSSTTSAAVTTSSSAPSSPSTTASTAGHTPSSCSAIPVGVISPYIGGVAATHPFAARPGAVSCEFSNATMTSVIILNLGRTNAASFAILRSTSAGGGRTIATIAGLGASAFSISLNGVNRGVDALSAQDLLVSVAANIPLARNEALVRQLMALY